MAVPPELAAAELTINLAELVENWRMIARQVAPAECGATIKANGYGCGATEVAQALWTAGCRTFFVALPVEGKQVRDALPEAVIYVLDGLFAGQSDFYIAHGLRPSLVCPEDLHEWADAAGGRHKAAVHIDTGINRLGFDHAQAEALSADADLMRRAGLCLLMSHLASGDDETSPSNANQRDRFAGLRTLFPDLPASLANAPGTFLGPQFSHDLVRPGVALYGGNPLTGKPNPMRSVISLNAPVLQVRDVAAGDGVGYGATWRADRPSRVAIVGVGYADGLLRAMSWPAQQDGPAKVCIAGQMAPIVGRVSMDMITIDVTDLNPEQVRRGTAVELLGKNIGVDDWARWAGTLSYEILTSLGRRYAKVYSS
ncbi:alanine racemase [Anderseniella sp. Alg231-50]|uniref:alanine racemase n=1 Tax=Anderseniella sp. Alg231-50 TaxID=1922226 RepID=UPI000D554EE8